MAELINAYTTTFLDTFANLKNGTYCNITSGKLGELQSSPITITGTSVALSVLLHGHIDYTPSNITYIIVLNLSGNNTSGYTWTMTSADLAETSTEIVSNGTITPSTTSATKYKLIFNATFSQSTNKGRFSFSIQAGGGVSSTIEIHQIKLFDDVTNNSFNMEIPTNDGVYEITDYNTETFSPPYPQAESRTITRVLRDSGSVAYTGSPTTTVDSGNSVSILYTDFKRAVKVKCLQTTLGRLTNNYYVLYGANVFGSWIQLVSLNGTSINPSGEYILTASSGTYTDSLGYIRNKESYTHDFSVANVASTTGAYTYYNSTQKYRYYKLVFTEANGSSNGSRRNVELFEVLFCDNDVSYIVLPNSYIGDTNRSKYGI